jgi:TetR/AcrR family transcriptional regulator
MLYYYYKSKAGLFVAVLEQMYEELRDQQRDLSVRANNPIMAMEQLIEHTFSALESNPNAIRLMNEENKHRAKYIRKSKRIRALYNPLMTTISFILQRGRKDRVFRASLDPAIVYLTLSSLCYHYLSNQYTLEIALDKDLSSAASRKEWLGHVTDLVLLYCVSDPGVVLAIRRAESRYIQRPEVGIERGTECDTWWMHRNLPQVSRLVSFGGEFGPFCKYAPSALTTKPESAAATKAPTEDGF